MADTVHSLDTELEQEVLAHWLALPSAEDRTFWFRVLDKLLPQGAELRDILEHLETEDINSQPADADPVRAATARLSLTGPPPQRPRRSWQAQIGLLGSSPTMEAILAEGRRIREAERNAAPEPDDNDNS